jgi:hypothetical protein
VNGAASFDARLPYFTNIDSIITLFGATEGSPIDAFRGGVVVMGKGGRKVAGRENPRKMTTKGAAAKKATEKRAKPSEVKEMRKPEPNRTVSKKPTRRVAVKKVTTKSKAARKTWRRGAGKKKQVAPAQSQIRILKRPEEEFQSFSLPSERGPRPPPEDDEDDPGPRFSS